jgi:hypothetical protein
MAVILVPDLSGKLIQRFARHVAVIAFPPVEPGHELVAFLGRERQHTVFQFCHTHLDVTLPFPTSDFNPRLCVPHLIPLSPSPIEKRSDPFRFG